MAAFPIQIRAIAYDLDGTLVDSAGDLAYAANLMREELNLPAIPESEIKTYIGKGIANLVRRAVMRGRAADDVVSDAYVEQALAICERHYHQHMCRTTRPYPGVVTGLEAARDKGLRLACITNKVARFTEPMLRELGLAQYFELTLSGDSLPEKKPHPAPLLYVAKFFNITPQQLLMVGDSDNDVEAAKAAGSPVFFFPHGYHQAENIDNLGVDAVVQNLIAIADLVAHPGR